MDFQKQEKTDKKTNRSRSEIIETRKIVLTISDTAKTLLEDFDFLENWEERYGYIIDIGAKLDDLPDAEKNETNRVHGCVSQVWLTHSYDSEKGVISFTASSDSSIVRGLIAMLLMLYHQQTPQDILAFQPMELFEKLGLKQHLSPSRSNGFFAMVEKIQSTAQKISAN